LTGQQGEEHWFKADEKWEIVIASAKEKKSDRKKPIPGSNAGRIFPILSNR